MFTLKFNSQMVPSKKPAGVIEGEEVFYRVRKTTVVVEKFDDKKNKIVLRGVATVTCSKEDTDDPALGQKHAIIKLFKSTEKDGRTKVWDKESRTEIWNMFTGRSKSASKIMGKV